MGPSASLGRCTSPRFTVRLLPLDLDPTELLGRVRVSPVTLHTVRVQQRLRRFIQTESGPAVYFRSFGDPRVISRKTGAVFESVDELRRADLGDGPRLRRRASYLATSG